MRRKPSEYAILGYLSYHPMSGYDIRKAINEGVGYFWRESYGQIYPALRRLALEGLVREQPQWRGTRQNRRVFALTGKGRAELRDWLGNAPKMQPPRNELLLKLHFGHISGDVTVRKLILQFRGERQKVLETYRGIYKGLKLGAPQAHGQDPRYWRITSSYGCHLAAAQVAWCDETLRRLGTDRDGRQKKRRGAARPRRRTRS